LLDIDAVAARLGVTAASGRRRAPDTLRLLGVAANDSMPISDHYGVLVDLRY
jgi:hypothetical protein